MQIKRFSKVFLVSLALLAIVALIGCGGGGGGGTSPPPPPPPETYTISATGGEGTGATGGDGGYVEISSLGANDAVVKTSGSVDTSFGDLVISEGIFDFGTNPWTVTSSITVKVYPSGVDSAVSANEYHMHINN